MAECGAMSRDDRDSIRSDETTSLRRISADLRMQVRMRRAADARTGSPGGARASLGAALVASLVAAGCGAIDALPTHAAVGRDAGIALTRCTVHADAGMCPSGSVFVAGGTFAMGSNDPLHPDESPVHDVTLDGFCMDTTEVTYARYVAGRSACAPTCDAVDPNFVFTEATLPMVWVTKRGAAAFCASACGRLPTEAEWERAARGLEGRRYPWGDAAPTVDRLWWSGNTKRWRPTSVGSIPLDATPEGIFDLGGNVCEWVSDILGPYPAYAVTNPTGAPPSPGDGDYSDVRIYRGGDWTDIRADDVSATRRRGLASFGGKSTGTGFRCVYQPAPAP